MSRSLKKGPFADASLLKKVDAMTASGPKADAPAWRRCHEDKYDSFHRAGFQYFGSFTVSGFGPCSF